MYSFHGIGAKISVLSQTTKALRRKIVCVHNKSFPFGRIWNPPTPKYEDFQSGKARIPFWMREMERGERSVSGSQILIFDYGGFQIRRNEEHRNEEHRNGGPPKRHSLCLLKKEAAPGGIAGTASRLIVYLIKHDSQLTSPAPSWLLSCHRSSCRCGCRCRAAWADPPSCR